MSIYFAAMVRNRLTLLGLSGYIVVLILIEQIRPLPGSALFWHIGLQILAAGFTGLAGYTLCGTIIGYKRTKNHLDRRRAPVADPAFKAQMDSWYCYRVGYQLAHEERNVTPL